MAVPRLSVDRRLVGQLTSLPQVFYHHQTDRGENWQPFEAEIKDTQWSGLIGYVSELY